MTEESARELKRLFQGQKWLQDVRLEQDGGEACLVIYMHAKYATRLRPGRDYHIKKNERGKFKVSTRSDDEGLWYTVATVSVLPT